MFSKKLLEGPIFYISAFLEANRDEYCQRLHAVSRDGDWTGWYLFFLRAIQIQAEENLRKTRAILAVYNGFGGHLSLSGSCISAAEFLHAAGVIPIRSM